MDKIVRFSEEKRRKKWGYGVEVAILTKCEGYDTAGKAHNENES